MTCQRIQPDIIFRLRSDSRAGFSAFLSLCTVVAECFQNSAELITRPQPANLRIHARQLRSRQLAARQASQEWTALEVAKCGTSQVVPRQSEETARWPRFETVVGPMPIVAMELRGQLRDVHSPRWQWPPSSETRPDPGPAVPWCSTLKNYS